jgi:DNA-binding transcriptional MerR regulator
MDKAPDAFLTIGEMAARLSVKAHILRYWEEQFPMLRPLKRAGGRRLYRPADVALLEQIKELLGQRGYTIRGARLFLQTGGPSAEAPPQREDAPELTASSQVVHMATIAAELKSIRQRLATVLELA